MAPPPVAPEASTDVEARLTAFVPVTVDRPAPTLGAARRELRALERDVVAADRDRSALRAARGVETSGHRTSPPGPPLRMIEPPLARAEATESSPGTLTALRIAFATVAALSSTRSSRGADLAGDVDQRLAVGRLRVRRHGDLQKIVAGQVQRRLLARAHRDLAERDRDDARIRHRSAEEADEAAGRGLDRAGVETPAEAPLPAKLRLPLLKSLSAMPSVEATKPPPTRTAPVGVIAIPFGLTR